MATTTSILFVCVTIFAFLSFGETSLVPEELKSFQLTHQDHINAPEVQYDAVDRMATKRSLAYTRWETAFQNKCAGVLNLQMSNDRPLGLSAEIGPACVRASKTSSPGDIFAWKEFTTALKNQGKTSADWAKCHIIANVMSGSNTARENFFPCWQKRFNNGLMKKCETNVKKTLQGGHRVRYDVFLSYKSGQKWASGAYIRADDISVSPAKRLLNVYINNVENPTLTQASDADFKATEYCKASPTFARCQ